jgi:hypothetical protein
MNVERKEEMTTAYPEHEKLAAIPEPIRQTVGDFIGWLEEQGMTLCTFDNRREEFYPAWRSRENLMAAFFEIDMDMIEDEKRAMLDAIRAA